MGEYGFLFPWYYKAFVPRSKVYYNLTMVHCISCNDVTLLQLEPENKDMREINVHLLNQNNIMIFQTRIYQSLWSWNCVCQLEIVNKKNKR